jgi:hypothetical protein
VDGEEKAEVEGDVTDPERTRGTPIRSQALDGQTNREPTMDNLIQALKTARELLAKYECYGQAQYVEKLISAIAEGDRSYRQLLNSVAMWGGAGAVWECTFRPYSNDTAQAHKDEVDFRKSIIEIARQMEALGIKSDRAAQIAALFETWNKDNL